MENASGESSIWLKEKWNPGEVKKRLQFLLYTVSMTCNYIMVLEALGTDG